MESNNFKLFETINETIYDIYDFLVRYLRTFGMLLFKPKAFFDALSSEDKHKQIVRPYNFILFSFIILVGGIEVFSTYYNEALLLSQETQEEGKKLILDDIIKLNTTSLIMKFLPSIILFILLAKGIEKLSKRIFKKENNFGVLFLYGIGLSCAAFSFITFLSMGLYEIGILNESIIDSDDAFIALLLLGLVLLLFLLIFPAFLMTRSLKYQEIRFVKRIPAFLVFFVLNILIVTGYIVGLTNTIDSEDEYDILFTTINAEVIDQTVKLTLIYNESERILLKQDTGTWLTGKDYYEEFPSFQAFSEINFPTSEQVGRYVVLKPNELIEMNMELENDYEFTEFDSLYNSGYDFSMDIYFENTRNDFKIASIVFSYSDSY